MVRDNSLLVESGVRSVWGVQGLSLFFSAELHRPPCNDVDENASGRV